MIGTKRLRAGVVGVGHLGRHHARIYGELSGVDLVGVVDHDAERAAMIAGDYGCRVFADAASLAREVDVVSIATPTTYHAGPALDVLGAGAAVLVEKPIALTVDEGHRIVEEARKRGIPLMVGHTERFNPAVVELLKRIDAPRFIEIHRLAPFKPRSLDVDVLLDLMIHDIDLTRWILGGQRVVRFDASGTAALTDRIDIASVRIRFEGGAAANLTASRISNEAVRRIRVFESGAYVVCDTAAKSVMAFRLDRDGPEPRIITESAPVSSDEPLGLELSAFCRAVAAGEPPPCTGDDGLAALELALEIRSAIDADHSSREVPARRT